MTRHSERLSAIVVGRTAYGEADLILRLLTPTQGKVSALARRARKSHKRFAGVTDLGHHIEARIRPGKGELWHIDEAELINGRNHIHNDLGRIALLAYFCEISGALARPQHPEPQLFGLLETACLLLDAHSTAPGHQFRMAFEAKVLAFSGLRPVLQQCVHCNRSFEPHDPRQPVPFVFSVSAGGAHHVTCLPAAGPSVTIDWLEQVEKALFTPLRDQMDSKLPAGPIWILSESIEHHIHAQLKSRALLAEVCA